MLCLRLSSKSDRDITPCCKRLLRRFAPIAAFGIHQPSSDGKTVERQTTRIPLSDSGGFIPIKLYAYSSHAAVGETVEGAQDLKGPRLRGLINAVLRNYQRDQERLDTQATSHDAGRYGHPGWLLKLLKESYPQQWQQIVEANNSKAPMWLRVNHQHHTRAEYQALLEQADIACTPHSQAEDALCLETPCDVHQLPGFADGWVSVQDAAAQLALTYLAPKAGELILDCCAAPGGKTAHILEHTPDSQVVAIDCDETRLKRVQENLQRLQLNAQVICGDARYPRTVVARRTV